jgi:hypothetical protein
MGLLIKTDKGTTGHVVGSAGTKLLCEEVGPDKYSKTGKRFSVEADKAEHIGFIDYPKNKL